MKGIFLIFYIAGFLQPTVRHCAAVVLELDCGNPNALHCPNELQNFTCAITNNVSMQWESSAFSKGHDIEFFGSELNEVKHHKNFTASITNKAPNMMTIVLSFPNEKELDQAYVKCLDFFDGNYKTCVININYPSPPPPPVNLTSIQLSASSVTLLWNMESNALSNDVSYNISVWISRDHKNSSSSYLISNGTELTLHGLQHSTEYSWSVEVETCMGRNKSRSEMFILFVKVPTPVENLKTCVYYSSENASYIANITWEVSFVNNQFQSPILQYALYISSELHYDGGVTDVLKPGTLQRSVALSSYHSLTNFTLSAISERGESFNNPSVIVNMYRSVDIKVTLVTATSVVILLSINFTGCVTPSLFSISISCFLYEDLANESQQLTTHNLLYRTDVDKDGKLIILRSLHPNTAYIYSVTVYEDKKLAAIPESGNFTTNGNSDLCDIQASKSNTYYDRSSETKQKHSISGAVQTTAHRTAPDDVPNTATMTITSQQYCQTKYVTGGDCERHYSWVLILLAVLVSFSMILLLLLCLISWMLLKVKRNIRGMKTALQLNRGNHRELLPWRCRRRNVLVMTENDAYATVQDGANAKVDAGYKNKGFRERYLT